MRKKLSNFFLFILFSALFVSRYCRLVFFVAERHSKRGRYCFGVMERKFTSSATFHCIVRGDHVTLCRIVYQKWRSNRLGLCFFINKFSAAISCCIRKREMDGETRETTGGVGVLIRRDTSPRKLGRTNLCKIAHAFHLETTTKMLDKEFVLPELRVHEYRG